MSDLVPSKYKWGASEANLKNLGGEIFRQSENPVMKSLYKKMQTDKNDLECLHKAATKNYACFDFDINSKFLIGVHFTDKYGYHPFHYAKDSVYFTAATFISRKGGIFMSHFDNFISQFYSMGIGEKTLTNDMVKVRKRIQEEAKASGDSYEAESKEAFDDANEHSPLSVGNVKAAFLMLAVGICLALPIFVIESAYKKCNNMHVVKYMP
ncbi:unnamed protein product [Orchesella dallaii]|uniref:Uncharacterized protein n=1 Tax=Orchesella dallaii TaxID=48710 RepID=A0ABP1RB00_9HEXA